MNNVHKTNALHRADHSEYSFHSQASATRRAALLNSNSFLPIHNAGLIPLRDSKLTGTVLIPSKAAERQSARWRDDEQNFFRALQNLPCLRILVECNVHCRILTTTKNPLWA